MNAGARAAAAVLAVGMCVLPACEPGPDGDSALAFVALPAPEPACTAVRAAAARAREARRVAGAKLARYPYAPAEGMAALELLLEAASCDALAGDSSAAATSRARASALRARLEGDYREHFMRCQRALGSSRAADALRDLDALLALRGHARDGFTTQLRNLQLELQQTRNEEENP